MVTVFDRDQQAVDVLYRIYRRVRLKDQVSRSAPLTMERAVERHALLIYAVEDAGRDHAAAARAGPGRLRGGDAVLRPAGRHRRCPSCPRRRPTISCARCGPPCCGCMSTPITHRTLTADRILLTGPELSEVILLDPGNGDVAASEIQRRLDLSQLLAEMALLVGPDRAADLATAEIGAELPSLVPLLQPVALHRSTRAELRRRKDVLPALRKRLTAAAPDGEEAPPVQLERFRLRTILTLVIGVVAADILVGQLTKEKFGDLHQRRALGLVAGRAGPVGAHLRRPPPGRCPGSCWRSCISAGPCWPSWPGRSSRWSPRRRSAAWR